VRREQDRQVLLRCEPLDFDPHRRASLGIETRRRFVEEEDARPVDEPDRHVEASFHAAGVAPRRPVGGLLEPDEPEELGDPRTKGRAAHAVDPALQEEVLASRGLPVDAGVLGDVADRLADALRMGHDVLACDEGSPGIRTGQGREHANGCRLAGAVRSQEAEDLAFSDRERDAVQRLHSPISLAEPLGDDRVHLGRV
jgi:hypothetical protein